MLRFEWHKGEEHVSIAHYFLEKFGVALQFPRLPVFELKPGKGNFMPAEFLT